MKHEKYKSIAGVWQQKEVAYLRTQGFDHPSIKWCVTEKVHGANFSFYMDLDELKIAKRSSFIKDGENFFQYLRMKEANGYKIREMWDQLVAMGEDINELIVYGELFGGFYPHSEVERLPNVQKIQKGVWYSNDIHFYCFDIKLNGEFLSMDVVEKLCDFCDILYAKILFQGTFDECLEYPNQFQTNIPKWLNIPLIDPNEEHSIRRQIGGFHPDDESIYKTITWKGNICEGIVIKPIEPLYYNDGDRVIFKSKNEVFLEASHEKIEKKKREHQEISEFAADTLELIVVYINENRLRNVLSKIGFFTKRDFKKVFDAFKKDVYEDFNINYDNLKFMTDLDKKIVDKVVGKLCTQVWRPIFLSEAER